MTPGFDGSTQPEIAKDVTIQPESTHTYKVEVTFTIPAPVRDTFDRVCGEGGGVPNTAEFTTTREGETGSSSACVPIEEPPVIDLGITKEAVLPEGETAIDPGTEFAFELTITNNSDRAAYEYVVTDQLPANVSVKEPITLPAGWTLDDTTPGKLVFNSEAGLAAGASAVVKFTVSFDPPREVEGEFDPDETDCDTVEVSVKQIDPQAVVECYVDAPSVAFNVTALNYELVLGTPLTLKWFAADGTEVLHTDTYYVGEDGTLSGKQLWPGATVNSDGISVTWPGWRVAGPAETPTWQNLVLDPTLDSYKFREPMRVEFSINPNATIAVVYPPAEVNCMAARTAELSLEKTASVTETKPNVDFTYTLAAKTTGLGALKDVVITDTIPAQVAVSDIAYGTAAFPTWKDCAITGDTNGYGGKLTCTLDGYAGPDSEFPIITLTAKARASGVESTVTNVAEVCGVVTESTPALNVCGQDEVDVVVKIVRDENPQTGEPTEERTPEPSEEPTDNPTEDTDGLASTGADLSGAYFALGFIALGVIGLGVRRRVQSK